MAKKKNNNAIRKEEEVEKKDENQSQPSSTEAIPKQKLMSDFFKKEIFVDPQQEKQNIFQAKIFAPTSSISIKLVLDYFKSKTFGKQLFGLERDGKDLVVSFKTLISRDEFLKTQIKIGKTELKASIFPSPPKTKDDLGAKYIISKVSMEITGVGLKKFISHLNITRYIFEKYEKTNVRTGRVIFWSKETIPASIKLGDKSSKIKKMEKKETEEEGKNQEKEKKAEEKRVEEKKVEGKKKEEKKKEEKKLEEKKVEEKKKEEKKVEEKKKEEMNIDPPQTPTHQTQRDTANLAMGHTFSIKRKISPTSRKTPPKVAKSTLEETAPDVDKNIFEEVGLTPPNCHSVLSIYEEITSDSHFEEIRNEVQSPIGKTKKQIVKLDRVDGGEDRYMLSVQETRDDNVMLDNKGSFTCEGYRELYIKKNWVQTFSYNTFLVLVLFKSRIFLNRNQQKE